MIRKLIALMGFVAGGAYAAEVEFDFFIDFTTCEALAGVPRIVDGPIVNAEGDLVRFICQRDSSSMNCAVLPSGGESTEQSYDVIIDTPPILVFGATNGSDFVLVNTAEHAAVLTTRTVTSDMLMSKLCHGIYATAFEIENMPDQ